MNKIAIYECRCDYAKPKYKGNPKLYYMDTDSFIVHVKLEDVYEDLAENVEKKLTPQTMKSRDLYPWQKQKTNRTVTRYIW